tara:strand:- start:936 stop:1085 length:150 start_codon:yes stop_codon:yes gene_type:complete
MAYIKNKNSEINDEMNSLDRMDYLSKDLIKFAIVSSICFLFMILIILFT